MGVTASLYYQFGHSSFDIPKKVIWPLCYAVCIQTIFGYPVSFIRFLFSLILAKYCCVSWANKYAPATLVALYLLFVHFYCFFYDYLVTIVCNQ